MSRKRKDEGQRIPLRSFSQLPRELQRQANATSARPDLIKDDGTAFAFYPPNKVFLVVNQTNLLYASMRRDPVVHDTVVIDRKDGSWILRLILEIQPEHFVVSECLSSRDCREIQENSEIVSFSDIERISVVVLASLG